MLNKVIENKAIKHNVKHGKCLSVLGDPSKLTECVEAWNRHGELFHLIAAAELLKWCESEKFNSEELKAFKAGLGAIPAFLSLATREFIANRQGEELLKEKAKEL